MIGLLSIATQVIAAPRPRLGLACLAKLRAMSLAPARGCVAYEISFKASRIAARSTG